MNKYITFMALVLAMIILAALALYNYPKADDSDQGLDNNSEIPHQTQENTLRNDFDSGVYSDFIPDFLCLDCIDRTPIVEEVINWECQKYL